MKRPTEAIENLIEKSNGTLLKNEGYVAFLLKAAISHNIALDFVNKNLI